MVGGSRTGLPLLGGIVLGACLSILFFSPDDSSLTCAPPPKKQFVDVSEHWAVHVDSMPQVAPNQDATPKVVRARFAATELGMRDYLMVAVLAESSLALTLNSTIGRHVPRIHLFADASRVDGEMNQLTNLSPYRSAEIWTVDADENIRTNGQKSHLYILGIIYNLTIHEHFDWFLLVKDSTYINPFQLNHLVKSMNWNEPVLMGEPESDGSGRCRLDSAVLISNPAMNILIHQRHACNQLASGSDSDQLAFEKCLLLATNLTCTNYHQGQIFSVWRAGGGTAAHDSIEKWRDDVTFNSTLSVTKLLSDADAAALHDHFVKVELNRIDAEISSMESEVMDLSKETDEGPTWPAAIPPYTIPPNRYQVPTWEFFTLKDIFRNEINQNVGPLEGSDRDDVMEVLSFARHHVENEERRLEFSHLRNGYRLFDSRRGMDYMMDLVYRDPITQESVERRVHLCRMIANTQLVNEVPYVKEDTDLVIVVPVNIESQVLPSRRLLARYARLCISPAEENRKTRIVIALSVSIDPRSILYINNDLEELKKRCKRSGLETDVLSVRDSSHSSSGTSPASAALDEAIDRFGQNTMFLVLSPHADVQKDLLDRVRINTIKRYQVFFPIPFVEFHPTISGMDIEDNEAPADPSEARQALLARLRDSSPPKRKKMLLVQKDHGRFDPLDFSCMAVYGSDYNALKNKLIGKRLDLISVFLEQDKIHILRAVEPTLRLRYHERICDGDLAEDDYNRCIASKKENVASKDQLAKMLFHEE